MSATTDLSKSLAEGLRAAGVTAIFGMPGGGPNLDMIGAAAECGIDFILAHSETAACMMASSHGRLTGTVGVAIVTRGPGLTSAINGLAQATLDRFPLVLISDTVSSAQSPRIAHQRLDQVATAAPVTKWSGILGAGDPAGVVAGAVALACAAPQGAVHLAFDPTQAGDAAPTLPPRAHSAEAELTAARTLVAAARRPVVIVGLDAVADTGVVRAALLATDAPLLVTYEAKGVIPETWPSFAGSFTGVAADRRLLEQADLIIGIGLDSVEPMPGEWPYAAEVLLLHSYPVETAYFGDPTLVVGDYSALLADVLPGLQGQWPAEARAFSLAEGLIALESESPLRPQDVVSLANEAYPGAVATVDAGAHMLVAMALWPSDEPRTVLISNGLATMGFALPAAIAAAIACPDRKVICFVGDGGLGMVLAELELVARRNLDLTVIVFNDATLTLIQLKQGNTMQGDATTVGYSSTDFAAIAAGMGLGSQVARSTAEFRGALAASESRPFLIDARVDAKDYQGIMRLARG